MHLIIAEELRDEVEESQARYESVHSTVVDRLLARIARRPGLWRQRMRTRHQREEDRLSPLPHAA